MESMTERPVFVAYISILIFHDKHIICMYVNVVLMVFMRNQKRPKIIQPNIP